MLDGDDEYEDEEEEAELSSQSGYGAACPSTFCMATACHAALAMRWLIFPLSALSVASSTEVAFALAGSFCGWALVVLIADVSAIIYEGAPTSPAWRLASIVGFVKAYVLAAAVMAACARNIFAPAGWCTFFAVLALLGIAAIIARTAAIRLYYFWAAAESLLGVALAHGLVFGTSTLLADVDDSILPRWQWFWALVIVNCVLSWASVVLQCFAIRCLVRSYRGVGSKHFSEFDADDGDEGGSTFPSTAIIVAVSVPLLLYAGWLLAGAGSFVVYAADPAGNIYSIDSPPPPCEGCYCAPRYLADEVQVMQNVTYGSAVNRLTGETEMLLLDIYDASNSSSATNFTAKPAAVLIHGGNCMKGDKSISILVPEAKLLARHGFVAFVIDYRLEAQQFLAEAGAFRDAILDAKAAVRFVVKNAVTYGVDPNRIAVWGASAGAIITASLSFVEDEGDSGNEGYPSNISAAIGMSGSVWPFLVHSTGPFRPPAPYFDMHGDQDILVFFFLAQMTQRYLGSLGMDSTSNRLAIVPGAGHLPFDGWATPVPPGDTPTRIVLRPHIHAFLVDKMGLTEHPC
eukprot:gnl/TRDRNA2_/TRDRNA2_192411_c0_seq1.p1 gnl/TRDRNA2_/TRDRNA2_192411_c0~~gnl/TRDRNA2_/TRDRNA2_192411_c0_seq1.p1  ORF type:complete len:602 (+),score=83.50 gnl/TRDRNA2_/TRDRNA2_192411_c0_seq1:89-1807(+)